MTEIKRCSKCGAMPTFIEYEQSIDGNHDTAAKVECRCGNVHRMTWDEFYQAQGSVPSEERGSAYLSSEEVKAINDVVIEAWNREQGDGLPIGPHEVYRIARRIREACGEEC